MKEDVTMRSICFAALLAATAPLLSAGPISITPIPSSGNVSGKAGSVVGWGFTLTNTTSDWLVLTGSSFTGSQTFGTYLDYLSLTNAPLYVAGPAPESPTVMQTWSPAATPRLGLGEFDINPTAIPNLVITGNIVVHYSLFSQDPNDPNFDPSSVVVPDATVSDPVTISLTPEPATAALMLAGALGMVAARRCRRR
jgi:PEP-CTERM motif